MGQKRHYPEDAGYTEGNRKISGKAKAMSLMAAAGGIVMAPFTGMYISEKVNQKKSVDTIKQAMENYNNGVKSLSPDKRELALIWGIAKNTKIEETMLTLADGKPAPSTLAGLAVNQNVTATVLEKVYAKALTSGLMDDEISKVERYLSKNKKITPQLAEGLKKTGDAVTLRNLINNDKFDSFLSKKEISEIQKKINENGEKGIGRGFMSTTYNDKYFTGIQSILTEEGVSQEIEHTSPKTNF